MNEIKKQINRIDIPNNITMRSKAGISKARNGILFNKKKWPIYIIPLAIALLLLTIYIPNNLMHQPTTQYIEGDYAIDVFNRNEVVGFADNVFIGKVTKKLQTINLRYPETQFSVEVKSNIKGNLSGEITVNQQAGYEDERLFIYEGDKLLEEGESYMFATRFMEGEGWHTAIPIGGDVPIKNEKEEKELIKNYTNSFKNEIPFKGN